MEFLLALLVSLVLAFFLSEALRKAGMPRVVGQIGAGIILGIPIIKGILFPGDTLIAFNEFANIAMILLFFFVGLEMNLRSLKHNFREGALVSVFSTAVPFLLGLALGHFLGLGLLVGAILGIALAVSSQTITFDLLEEFGLLKSRVGTLIIGSGAMDDIIEFIILSVILASIQLSDTALQDIVVNVLAFVGVIAIFKIFVIPWLLSVFEKQKTQRALFMGAIIITALMAYLATLLGMSSLIGAFAAGVIVRQVLLTGEHPRPWEEHEIAKTLDTVSFGFFVPLFFVFVGLNTDLGGAESVGMGLLLTALAIIGTVGGSTIGAVLAGRGVREGMVIGLGVTPKGDVELVVAVLALESGLIGAGLFSAIVFMAIATMLVAPLLFRHFCGKWKEELRVS
ncbi:MAG: cation:proton antiporter [Candidatus Micrarchaeia archaeon]|jgi:Kef-type K+ transport system membrane component KefB